MAEDLRWAVAALLLALGVLAAAEPNPPVVVDNAKLQAAIDRELEGVPRDGKLDVVVHPDGTATVTYIRADGLKLERTVSLPPRPDDAVEMLALLAGNLVRDQAGDVIADLSLPPPPPFRHRRVLFSLGIFPPVSTDLVYGGPVIANVAVNLLVGSAPGVRGLSLSGAIDIHLEYTSGAHIAGVTTVALRGAAGLQLAGASAVTLGRLDGVQLSGGVNVAGDFHGLQLGGLLNVAKEFTGVQIGPINVAGKARGVQIGAINYSEDIDGVSFAPISIVRKGITELDVWGESFGTAHLMLRHGARRFHNLYGLATSAPGDDSVKMYGLGFGSRLITRPVDLDVGLITWNVGGPGVDAGLSILNQARLTAAVRFGHFAVFGGAAANVFVGDSDENGDALHPILDRSFSKDGTTARLWPSIFAGIRVR